MKRTAVLILTVAMFGSACVADAPGASGLIMQANVADGAVNFQLFNATKQDILIQPDFAYAGTNGGNIIGLIVTSFGQVAAPCMKLDSFSTFGHPAPLGPSESKTLKISVADIAEWHCLGAGDVTAIFAYKSLDGSLIFSEPVRIHVQ